MIPTAGIDTSTCPITGMALRRCSEWTEMELDDGYRATIFLLGGRIIVGRPVGHVTMDGAKKILRISQGIIDEYLDPARPYIHIQDYSYITGADLKARKYFSDEMKKRQRTRAAIFCGQTPWGRIAFQLAVRLHNFPYDMLIARDYPQAALLARKIVMEEPLSPPRSGAAGGMEQAERNPEWEVEGDGFKGSFEILEGSIVHSRMAGRMDEDHVRELGQVRAKVIASIDKDIPLYFLTNLSRLQWVSRKARKDLQAQFFTLGGERRVGGFFMYGANALVRSAVYLGRPFSGVQASLYSDFDAAMAALRKDRAQAAGTTPTIAGPHTAGDDSGVPPVRRHVEEVLEYISGQNWDREGPARRPDIADDHPFMPVFDALDLIKMDLDDLFREHREIVEELQKTREGLWERIAERTADLSSANDRLRQTDLQRRRRAADLNANLGCIFGEIADAAAALDEKGAANGAPGAQERIRTSLKAAEKVMDLFCREGVPGGDVKKPEECRWPLEEGEED